MTLTVDSERVIEAAKQCPDASKVLKAMFPEAFKTRFYPGTRVFMIDNTKVTGVVVGGSIGEALHAHFPSISGNDDIWVVGMDGSSAWNHRPDRIGVVWAATQ